MVRVEAPVLARSHSARLRILINGSTMRAPGSHSVALIAPTASLGAHALILCTTQPR